MKTAKKIKGEPLETIIQRKLDRVNPFVKNIDWDKLNKQIEANKIAIELNVS